MGSPCARVDLNDREQINTYTCSVMVDGETDRYEVEHPYSDGAIILMAKVFGRASL